MSVVLYSVSQGVATLTLNRPQSRNALNLEMCDRFISVFKEIQSNKEIRLVLIRANGPVFCAGADLKERQGMNEAQVRERRMQGFAAYAALEALPMPAIAVVEGVPNERLGQATLRKFPGFALPENRPRLRSDRHDRERQGAEDKTARACLEGVRTLMSLAPR